MEKVKQREDYKLTSIWYPALDAHIAWKEVEHLQHWVQEPWDCLQITHACSLSKWITIRIETLTTYITNQQLCIHQWTNTQDLEQNHNQKN